MFSCYYDDLFVSDCFFLNNNTYDSINLSVKMITLVNYDHYFPCGGLILGVLLVILYITTILNIASTNINKFIDRLWSSMDK